MSHVTIIGGTHRGKTGIIVSHTPHFTKVDLGNGVVRCKKTFVQLVPQPVPQLVPQLVPQPVVQGEREAMIKEQERILKDIQDKREKKLQNAKISQMISAQKQEYEEGLKKDLERAEALRIEKEKVKVKETPVFEEPSVDEMRRVRLLRFM